MTSRIPGQSLNRRDFLTFGAKTMASAGLIATAGSLQTALAAATDTSGYKALVCVFLSGGNNGFNTIVPTSQNAYDVYRRSRSNLALAQGSLLPLNGTASDGNSYGLHASCTDLRTLFNAGRVAVLGNVGPLIVPTSKAQFVAGSVPLPPQLFSHIDQQIHWWTSNPTSTLRHGWAGRIADLYTRNGYNPRLAMNINVGGSNYWQEGSESIPYVLGPGGAPTRVATSSGYRNNLRRDAALALLNEAGGNPNIFTSEFTGIENHARSKVSLVNDAFAQSGSFTTQFQEENGDSGLAAQLRAVARTIRARSQIGDSRQIFFVNMGGFDTHNGELNTQGNLLRMLSRSINAFQSAMNEIGQQNNVTLFTASDFGRSLGSNGDGSDHAWGNHHMIVGGAVRGGYYGRMPSLELNGADDASNGRVLPTTATDQYAATLAKWFGVADADLPVIFPNLANFPTRTLGFI